jgi:hypothetical protein
MATRNTQYIIRVGSQNETGDGFSYLSGLDPLAPEGSATYRFAGPANRAIRFTGRPAAEEAALNLFRMMRERGHTPPVRLVPARGGMETGFRPEKAA